MHSEAARPGSARLTPRLLAPAGLGFAGSLLVTLAACDLLRERPIRWWLDPHLPLSHAARLTVLYAGLVLLAGAWLWLGRAIARRAPSRAFLMAIGLIWAAPLLAGPAVFSRDLYSYLAQGLLVHLGIDPYRHAAGVLAASGHRQVVDTVSPFWRHTVAPYGPLFLALAALAAAVAGGHPALEIILLRVPELAGLVLLALSVPVLARRAGADPARALWLAVLSPLALIELLGAGHNDALMAGLLAAGVALALEERPLAGITLCALGTTVKLPAALGILFIAICWTRAKPARAPARLAAAAAVSAAVCALVTWVAGTGFGWLGSRALSAPAHVRLAITPATEVGYVVAWVLRHAGVTVSARSAELACGRYAILAAAALVLLLARRVTWVSLPSRLGAALLVLVLAGPASWPWYLIWGAALLAGVPAAQRSHLPLALLTLPVALIGIGGQLLLPRGTAPAVLLAYLLAGWLAVRRLHRSSGGGLASPAPPAPAPTASLRV